MDPSPPQEEKKSGRFTLVIVFAAVLALLIGFGIFERFQSRMSVGSAFGGAGFVKLPERTHYPVYDVEPQVIYRLDDERYLELDNYERCRPTDEDGSVADVWYRDSSRGIRTRVSTGTRNYQGMVINADPSGKNIVLPISNDSDSLGCRNSDYKCYSLIIIYSTDYGRTFKPWGHSETIGSSGDPSLVSKKHIVVMTDKELIAYSGREGDYSFTKIETAGKLYRGKPIDIYGSTKTIPTYPVAMTHYQCDDSIRPTSIGSITAAEYKAQPQLFPDFLSTLNAAAIVLDGIGSSKVILRTHYAVYDVEPQVLYRTNGDGYVELGNYSGCTPTYEDEKVVDVWYRDPARGINTRLFSKMRNYQGRVINVDPSGKNLAFPVMADRTSCAEDLCGESMVYYSTDYGKTFKPFYYIMRRDSRDEALDPPAYSKHFTTVMTENTLTVYVSNGYEYKYTRIALENDDRGGESRTVYGQEKTLPNYSVEMDSYQCDAGVKPRSVGGVTVEEYDKRLEESRNSL